LLTACAGEIGETGTADTDGPSEFDPAHPDAVPLVDDVVGVSLAYPSDWKLLRDPYLFDTHGFVLGKEDVGGHGVAPIVRVAIDHQASPDQLDARVAALRAEFPDLDLEQWAVEVAGREATAVGPLPGAQPSIALFVPADGRLLRLRYYGEAIDERAADFLSRMQLVQPTRTVAELGLLPADSPQARFGADRPSENIPRSTDEEAPAEVAAASWGEWRLRNGCWGQPSSLFLQTTHSRDANGTGWSRMGTPNFWGDNTHGNWGMGRCTSTYYTNDLYAIDYYLRPGDRLYSPLADGYVTYAGWDPEGWWNYGKMVVIATPGGKYWSLSAHMSFVNVVVGQRVDRNTLIGWAGSTGYAAPYPHVHQVYYRWASTSRGRPYGGQGLRPSRLRYIGNGGGAYTTFWQGRWTSW
jgi:murein DD-endopeptidase MepM/ murein hydrolase activator NlpD